MIFFSWKGFVSESKNNPLVLLDLFKQYVNKRILKPNLHRKLLGSSYLINPTSLLEDKSVDVLYLYQYLHLASLRDYTLYKLYGMKTLPLAHYPDLNIDGIKTNPLLVVTKNEITFKYEGK